MSNSGKHYGIVRIEDQQEMSGLEFVEGLVDGTLPLNTMAETLGYDGSRRLYRIIYMNRG